MDTISSPKAPSRAVIIGGGLAGMVAANELLKQKIPVLLLEKEKRTGGKAGADFVNGVFEEHGYHVFPTFYANTLALIDEIGASNNLVPITKFHYLLAPDTKPKQGRGVYPNSIVFLQPDSISAAVKLGNHPLVRIYFVLLCHDRLVQSAQQIAPVSRPGKCYRVHTFSMVSI